MANRKVDKAILAIYAKYPHAVNDDAILLDCVWRLLGWDETKSLYWNLSRLPRPESITRARRKLHEQGKIVYSKQAHDRRMKAFVAARDEHSNHKPQFVA